MPTACGCDDDGWVSVTCDANLKYKGYEAATSGASHAASQNGAVAEPEAMHHKAKLGAARGVPGLETLMQSQYFSKDVSMDEPVSLLSVHPLGENGGGCEELAELFADEGSGYLDDDASDPDSPNMSLTPSLIEELESSVSRPDSRKMAVAFASLARTSEEKGQPTIISMRLVPKARAAGGGLAAASATPRDNKDSSEVYTRMSVVGPIDLCDPGDVERGMAETSASNAYLVTEMHPGPDHYDRSKLSKEEEVDLLWDWSVFREEDPAHDLEKMANTNTSTARTARGAAAKNRILADIVHNSVLYPITKRIFWERILPTLITTHVVSVLVGVVIGRRLMLGAPQDRR